jgi:hypothetical protein
VGILFGLEDAIRSTSFPSVLHDYDFLVLVGQKKAKILIFRGESHASQEPRDPLSLQRVQHELKRALRSLNSDLKQTSVELALERFAPKLEAILLMQTESPGKLKT